MAMASSEELVRGAAGAPRPWPPLAETLGESTLRSARVRGFVEAARRHVQAVHEAGAGGVQVVDLWTRLVDHALMALFRVLAREHGLDGRPLALFALGGYGREELSPHSDLDLLVLRGEGLDPGPFVEGFLYPLWDAGLDVQAVARTLRENVEVARADSRSRSSLLEGRYLAGDPALAAAYQRQVVEGEIFGRDVRAFVEAKLEELEARRRRYGSTVYLVEPNVKEGEGGLRDIHTALWIAKVRYKVRSAAELLHKGVVPPGEVEALSLSRDFLLRVRTHLHFLAGRREDRLTYEWQDVIAPFFGYGDEGEIPGVERFLQAFYASANGVGHFTRVVIRRACAGLLPRSPLLKSPPREVLPGVRLQAGEIHLSASAVSKRPLTLLAAFEAAQVHGAELSPQALEVVRENLHLVDDRFRRDPDAVGMFLRILRNPRRVATTLMRMHDVRFLDRFIPELERIFGRVQRDLYHAYPVDVHSLFAVQELRRMARGEYGEPFPTLTRLMGEVRRQDILYLAALLHDVGKGEGRDHAERGAEIALAVGDRMGFGPEDLEYLVFLVRHHLLLSHVSQGRDLHDADLVRELAARVRDAEALKMLYLLTVADIRAVGPGAWTSWKDMLLRELYDKALEVLETGGAEQGLARERSREVEDRVREAGRGIATPEDVEAFLAGVDHPQYLLSHPLEALLGHLALFVRRGEDPVLAVRAVPAQGYTEVLLLTRDRPGLFACIAGLLAAHRINVLSAVLNTRRDGWALDALHLSSPLGGVLEDPRCARWQEDLRAVLRGEASFEGAVGGKLQRPPGLPRPRPRLPPRVALDNAASRRFTVVDLKAADRLGLLYDVSRTFASQGLTIRLAKIATNIEQVSDSFYVERVEGGKLLDPEAARTLEHALLAALAGTGSLRGVP
ncbi:MAG: [protein-PII] uridylyltransferase [Deferrisomatales bacterium]|nr:[protein-PII] uridylyltransferase [Deferrisomatales bacterium]